MNSHNATTAIVELDRDECLALVATTSVGRVAVNGSDGAAAPLIRPVTYAFDEPSQSIVFRTGEGSKLHALTRAAHAAFEVDGFDGQLHTGWSVVIAGVTEAIDSPAELARLQGTGLAPWAPGERGHWIRIRARVVSGRRIIGGRITGGRIPGRETDPAPGATQDSARSVPTSA